MVVLLGSCSLTLTGKYRRKMDTGAKVIGFTSQALFELSHGLFQVLGFLVAQASVVVSGSFDSSLTFLGCLDSDRLLKRLSSIFPFLEFVMDLAEKDTRICTFGFKFDCALE